MVYARILDTISLGTVSKVMLEVIIVGFVVSRVVNGMNLGNDRFDGGESKKLTDVSKW